MNSAKDWRGVIIEALIIVAMCYAMTLDKALAMSVITALAAWGGSVIQRAKIDALNGMSLPPGTMSAQSTRIEIPPYKPPPNFRESHDTTKETSIAP